MTDAERVKALYDRRRAAGVCVKCETPLADDMPYARCLRCRKRHRSQNTWSPGRQESDPLDTLEPMSHAEARIQAEVQAGQRCPRCALLLPCGCSALTIEAFASMRRAVD